MFSEDQAHWGIVYSALIHAIKTNSGIGFHNSDQGHLAYAVGAKDGRFDLHAYGDSPDKNHLFQMLKELSQEYGGTTGSEINNWQQFCKLAYDSYQSADATGS